MCLRTCHTSVMSTESVVSRLTICGTSACSEHFPHDEWLDIQELPSNSWAGVSLSADVTNESLAMWYELTSSQTLCDPRHFITNINIIIMGYIPHRWRIAWPLLKTLHRLLAFARRGWEPVITQLMRHGRCGKKRAKVQRLPFFFPNTAHVYALP